jgi:deazaflavin-dependent oxidoreductase (nitroreductase family)
MATLSTHRNDAVPVHEMVVIHRIFRREFARLAGLVRRCPGGHVGWAGSIGEHADFIIAALHYHHSTEDELLWPLLMERAQLQAGLVHRMEVQHLAVARCLDRAQELLAGWRAAPTAPSGQAAADALGELSGTLAGHLDDEESHILPLVSQHITVAEWQQIGEQSFAKFSNAEKLLALGLMLDVATPEEAASFLAGLPWPIQMMWRLAGRRRYTRYAGRVEGRFNPALRRWMRRANRVAVALYRVSGGRIGGTVKGCPVLLLTVPGRTTGIPRTVPVGYVRHDGGYLVAGTAGGSTVEPQWFGNLRAAQRVALQIGGTHQQASCRIVGDEERDRLWPDVVVAQAPIFGPYEKRCARPIPLAALTPDTRDAAHTAPPEWT